MRPSDTEVVSAISAVSVTEAGPCATAASVVSGAVAPAVVGRSAGRLRGSALTVGAGASASSSTSSTGAGDDASGAVTAEPAETVEPVRTAAGSGAVVVVASTATGPCSSSASSPTSPGSDGGGIDGGIPAVSAVLTAGATASSLRVTDSDGVGAA